MARYIALVASQFDLATCLVNARLQKAGHSIPQRSQGMQDFLLVSSFGLWAVLLGLTPVLAFRLVMAS